VKKVLDLKQIPSDSSEAEPLTAKYKVFYFSKYIDGVQSSIDNRLYGRIDPADYEQWKRNKDTSQTSFTEDTTPSTDTPDPSRPWFQQTSLGSIPVAMASDSEDVKGPSFDEIVDLITTGKPVPGIRQIPDQLSTEIPSTSSTPTPPKKPWEKDVSE